MRQYNKNVIVFNKSPIGYMNDDAIVFEHKVSNDFFETSSM